MTRFHFALILLASGACATAARSVPLELDAANPDAEETPARAPLTVLTPVGAPAAEPVTPSARALLSCPMHPEVTSKTPGKCPKCGMALTAEGGR